jgi:hypothetical protein
VPVHHHQRFNVDRPSCRRRQSHAHPAGFTERLDRVGLLAAPDEYHGPADCHSRTGMVLGVDGEHAGLADEKVVDVAAAAESNAVQHVPPATAEPVKFPPDLSLPARADPPGQVTGAEAKGSGRHPQQRIMDLQLRGPPSRAFSCLPAREVTIAP